VLQADVQQCVDGRVDVAELANEVQLDENQAKERDRC